ncbi:anhydro-N-acetylmuramic acid kinase [Ideonella sp. A 288]|uniref:anhydro-N-acetylmuramic acid kinase n=1 Tax=Ideonella sp. A 288 TaxID=1962181 RepID=UPI000B4BE8CE|nr:anhydro-N-acetylmuramic acid kinase [Ideonella sp. A 288]
MALYVGQMSGTSMDGVDSVLVRIPGEGALPVQVLGHDHGAMPPALRQALMDLNAPGANELHRAALAANALADWYADSVHRLLAAANVAPADVRAIGAHGQTVRHRPGEFDRCGYTIQLLNGAALAERSGIDVACDFRSRDVAAGGQGAPLVPAFHAACWFRPGQDQAVLNVGGIANLSLLRADGGVGGFDCGPGNALMDHWCARHTGAGFDAEGTWAASGQVHDSLLEQMLAEPYFAKPPPKSTGRDLFNPPWLDAMLSKVAPAGDLAPEAVQATLTELTARAACLALQATAPATTRLMVCGGGALNAHLMRRIQAHLARCEVVSTSAVGLPPLQVEAAAFAWLAYVRVEHLPGNRPEVTGAAGSRVLGALHPAG